MKPKKTNSSDLNKRRIFFFQLGLILVLFASWQSIEYETVKEPLPEQNYGRTINDYTIEESLEIRIPTSEPPKLKTIVQNDYVAIVENDTPLQEQIFQVEKEPKVDDHPKIKDVVFIKEPEPIEVFSHLVEEVPVFQGCEKLATRKEKEKCMANSIQELIAREFNDKLGSDLGLSGINRIYVTFKVNEKGEIENIKSKAHHILLEKEAERVVNMLPKMKPGKQGEKPVGVLYSIPIVLQVQE